MYLCLNINQQNRTVSLTILKMEGKQVALLGINTWFTRNIYVKFQLSPVREVGEVVYYCQRMKYLWYISRKQTTLFLQMNRTATM